MDTAKSVIKKFGGQSALARLINKNQSTVQYWARAGTIPAKWHESLIRIAREQDINLSAADLVSVPQETDLDDIDRVPKATHWGELEIGDTVLPCYVLENGERVFSLKGVVVGLIETDGGQLAEYIKVKSIKPYLPNDLVPAENGVISALIKFDTSGESFAKYALGLPVEKFIDLCEAYSKAAEASELEDSGIKLTERQKRIAINANRFLRASAKVGIIALVDEVTGYQYDRAADALQFKLKLFLEEDMRKWEKTFPDDLWVEFGRVTKWKGTLHQRPKYWGKLVMELVYGYLDQDVANWLRDNAPRPLARQSYHQWMSSQYGLKKLIEHIWMLIGMARSCTTMRELREKMAHQHGRHNIQLNLFVPPMAKKTL